MIRLVFACETPLFNLVLGHFVGPVKTLHENPNTNMAMNCCMGPGDFDKLYTPLNDGSSIWVDSRWLLGTHSGMALRAIPSSCG